MVKKPKEPKDRLKRAVKSFKEDGMKQEVKKAILVERTNYDKGIKAKRKVQKKADKPFGSTIGKM